MMLVCVVVDLDVIFDKLIAMLLVIWLTASSTFINTTNDPKLITNPNRNASVDTIFVFG
jgi:hypothetical protein